MRKIVVALGLGLAVSTAGCDRNIDPPQPKTATLPPTPATQPVPAQSGDSKDPSLPPAERALAPQPKDGTPGTALTQKEMRKDMPLPGQANDHSTEVRAKVDSSAPTGSN